MFNKIKSMFDRRIIALLAVLAIGVSGTASMAALTDTLTVTSTFAGAQIIVKGNGEATATTLFNDNQVMKPGDILTDGLQVTNGGNIAAHFTYTPPQIVTGPGNLKDVMLVTIYNPDAIWTAAHSDGQGSVTEAPVCDNNLINWTVQAGPYLWADSNITVSSFDLDPEHSRFLCYKVEVPSSVTSLDDNTSMQVIQSFTGVQP